MEILFYLTAIFVFSWLAGFVTVVLLQNASIYHTRAIRITLPVVGYASSNLLWWAGTFLLKLSTGIVLSIWCGIALAAFGLTVRRRFSKRSLWRLLPARCDWPLLIVFSGVVALSAWPYITVGLGNYFLFNETDYFSRVIPSVLLHNQVPPDILAAAAGSKIGVLRDQFPLQLSSLTLLQRLLGCTATDAASLQAIIDLLFTSLGVYWLSRYVFGFRVRPAIAAAVFSVAAQFYYHTYLDGHLGSLMYVSAAPVLFGLCMRALMFDRYRITMPMIGVLWLFMSRAYPLVSYLLLPPLLLAKSRLVYLDRRKTILAFAVKISTRTRLPPRVLTTVAVMTCLGSAIPAYYFARTVFYPNRISVIFNGYQPMYMVFDPRVLEWFFGLRLTRGFGYGFIQPGPNTLVRVYDIVSMFFITGLVVSITLACCRRWRIGSGSFLAAFVLVFPLLAIGFASVWPFSYLIYKFLYVYYFLIVIAVVAGVQAIPRRRHPLTAWLLYSAVAGAAGLNLLGSVRNAAIAVDHVTQTDLADLHSLVGQLKARGITRVARLPSSELSSAIISYSLRQEGVAVSDDVSLGQPLLTDEHATIASMADADIALRSAKGRYALSYTPKNLVEVYSLGGSMVEIRDRLAFLWLNTRYEYDALQFDQYFGEAAQFLKSLRPAAVTYNDLPDSGFYLVVETLFDKYRIRKSDNARECGYFLRLNHGIYDVEAKLERNRKKTTVVAPVQPDLGKLKVVRTAYRDNGRHSLVWSNDLFEIVFIPPDEREVSEPSGVDAKSLIEVIRNNHLKIADGISPLEHERLYLEDRLAANGIRTIASNEAATAVLLCVPNAILRNGKGNALSPLWRASPPFSEVQGYDVVLLDKDAAVRVMADQAADPVWATARPLRTLLWPVKGDELTIRVHQPDRELRLLFETGPSLREPGIVIRALRKDGRRTTLSFTVAAPSQVIRVPVDHFAIAGEDPTDLTLESDLHFGKRLMPYDDRLLMYRLLACELAAKSDPLYTESLKRKIRAGLTGDDVVDAASSSAFALGTGWFQRELENGSPFRWMSDGADIVLEAAKTTQRRILVTGLVGPSAPSGKISFLIRLNGVEVATTDVDGRAGRVTLEVDCNSPAARRAFRSGQNVITMSTRGGGQKIPGDSRVLNFRVFQIRLA